MSKDFDKQTVIVIDWVAEKGTTGYQSEMKGDKLPDSVLRMLVNDYLEQLGIKIRVHL